MVVVIKNAITGCIIGIAKNTDEAVRIAESKSQPYVFEVELEKRFQ